MRRDAPARARCGTWRTREKCDTWQVRGSHKLNLPVPPDFTHGVSPDLAEHTYQPATKAPLLPLRRLLLLRTVARQCYSTYYRSPRPTYCQAGDVLIWSEATVHGATPWRADHQRRIAIYRFAPANMGYGRGYLEVPDEVVNDMTPAEAAVVAPPYATRLDRPVVTPASAEAGETTVAYPRSELKKDLDRQLFGTSYF